MKKVAILQSNYIPWKGYFDLIAGVDEFILYDDMQYTRRDWRNRNKIKTAQGTQWLTVPVKVKGQYEQRINQTRIDGVSWAEQHWKSLYQNYRRAAYFDDVASWLQPIYSGPTPSLISELNFRLIEAIVAYLGITTTIRWSSDYTLIDGASERLADLCQQAGASEYVSGPSARDYLDEAAFDNHGISVSWFDYDGYKPYPQLWGEYLHQVSILDLLFNCGPDSAEFMRYVHR